MRLGWTKKGPYISYFVHRTIRVDGKNKSQVIRRLGSEKSICETYGVTDAKSWCLEQVDLMRKQEAETELPISLALKPDKDLELGKQLSYNMGYLFIQKIYHELGLDKICRAITVKHKFDYNLNSILSRLIYTRMLYPSSKRTSFEDAKKFIEEPKFELHQIYRALSVLADESDYIQSTLFKNSMKIHKRDVGIIYYDCTNYYFEIENAKDDKQYGASKENRPLPIVEMGLFMDRDGIPIAFAINPGNRNEQLSLIPLEKKLIDKFDMSKFVVCTDAGLSSADNRKFNSIRTDEVARAYVTTRSLKKIKAHLKEWALAPEGWSILGEKNQKDGKPKLYNISNINEEKHKETIFYKSRWIKENDIEEQLIVSYSVKYRDFQRTVRNDQIARAEAAIAGGASIVERKRQNDPKRFIKSIHATRDGEIASVKDFSLNTKTISKEEAFDGFYAVVTNLEENAKAIVSITKRRWEIEECFRIMKSDFEARPVFLQRQERIIAHFITCFISLVIYRYLEKKTGEEFSCPRILKELRDMNCIKFENSGYVPTYTRTELTDAFHKAFGFNTAKEIIPIKTMRTICALTKKADS